MYMCYKLSWIIQDHPRIAILDVKAFSLSNPHLAIWDKNLWISKHHPILQQPYLKLLKLSEQGGAQKQMYQQRFPPSPVLLLA